MTTLIPPDLNQCQAEILEGSFMTLGPRKYYRCTNKPSYIARENEPGPDGQYGSMSLCRECRMIMVKKILDGELTNITIAPIGAT